MDWVKERCIAMSQYFPKPCDPFWGDINIKLDLSNYAIKSYLKVYYIYTSEIAKKVDLASLKSSVDKSDIDELKNVSTDLIN